MNVLIFFSLVAHSFLGNFRFSTRNTKLFSIYFEVKAKIANIDGQALGDLCIDDKQYGEDEREF